MPISVLVITGHSDAPETHLLIGLHQQGIALCVLCPHNAPHRHLLQEAQVPIFDLTLKSRHDREGIQSIRQRLKQQPFDIIHAFNNKALSNALIASKKFNAKIIAYRGIEGNVSYWDPASWSTYLHPRVHTIVCVAVAIRHYFHSMRFLGIKAPVNKAITIYKGHNPDWYNESISLEHFNIKPARVNVGCTVNDRPRKGLVCLIDGINQLPPNLDINFVLIGKINNPKLLHKINCSPYHDRIHLLGFQSKAAAIIRNCDVCILPAIKREGLPKAIIEGMIQEVAPIVTNSGGSPELIEHGISGLIVTPKSPEAICNALVNLYEQPELLQEMKVQAKRRIVDNFTIQETIKRHLTLYRSLHPK